MLLLFTGLGTSNGYDFEAVPKLPHDKMEADKSDDHEETDQKGVTTELPGADYVVTQQSDEAEANTSQPLAGEQPCENMQQFVNKCEAIKGNCTASNYHHTVLIDE